MHVKFTCLKCDDFVGTTLVDEENLDRDVEQLVAFLGAGLYHVLATGHEMRLAPRDRLRVVGE